MVGFAAVCLVWLVGFGGLVMLARVGCFRVWFELALMVLYGVSCCVL